MPAAPEPVRASLRSSMPAAYARWAVAITVITLVGVYDLWAVRATGQKFVWGHDLGGYYNYLGRALATGHLHLPVEPSPALLSLPNPYDPSVDDSLKMHDVALYRGKYFLYHGAGPAVLLFVPWRLITGHDLPENFALFLLAFGGFLFSAAALWALELRPGPALLGLMLLALGVGQGVPFLLNRVWVYEIAVAGGYFCTSAAFCFLILGLRKNGHAAWLAASGLLFGLAVACRPHLLVAAAIASALLWSRRRDSRALTAFLTPLMVAGVALASYNYARFGNPLEFGVSYLLAGPNQNRIKLAIGNIPAGLYYLLLSPPDFSAVFPWVRPVFRFPFGSEAFRLPAGYIAEPTVGALQLAPVMLAMVLIPLTGAGRRILLAIAATAVCLLLFLSATGWSTQRYEVDFLPMAVLASVAALAAHPNRSRVLTAWFACAIVYGVGVNLAIGVSGPYDDLLRNKPASYLRIARWFSPVAHHRPALNPAVDIQFTAELPLQPGYHDPLVTLGHGAYRYYLYTEHPPGKFRLFSQSESSTKSYETGDRRGRTTRFQIGYSPDSQNVVVWMDGDEVLTHRMGTLVTAPSQVSIGENTIDRTTTDRRFQGRITEARATVRVSR